MSFWINIIPQSEEKLSAVERLTLNSTKIKKSKITYLYDTRRRDCTIQSEKKTSRCGCIRRGLNPCPPFFQQDALPTKLMPKWHMTQMRPKGWLCVCGGDILSTKYYFQHLDGVFQHFVMATEPRIYNLRQLLSVLLQTAVLQTAVLQTYTYSSVVCQPRCYSCALLCDTPNMATKCTF